MASPDLTEFLVAFGERVQFYRKEKGWTQLDLSVQTGIEIRQLRRIEKGETNTSIGNLKLLAAAFGVEMGELVGDSN
ncbi:MAG: helix-turn-helix transcriptional regulator [Bacteroidia bacterium]|nr:helix-turn-helix transcriptional regulator [Bacteroidia bacterium]